MKKKSRSYHGMGSGADVNSKYPGMPPAWGVGMTEAQRDAAYAQHTRQSRRLYVGSLPKPVNDEALHAFFNNAMVNTVVLDMLDEEEAKRIRKPEEAWELGGFG